MRINKHDTQGTKPLLGKGELGYDDYAAGGDVGRVYVGTGSENIALAEKSEIDSHVNRVDNPHNVTKAQVGLESVDNTADVNKNVLSATKWTTARTITLSGDVAGSVSMDGTANVSITTTVQPNSVALGTDTTGNYVAGITQGTGITVSGTAGEGWSPTVTITNVGTAGTYTKVTTNAQGQVTSGTTLAATDIPALDASKITTGIIDAARLPAYIDDVLEFANQASFPATGESGKIYVALDTNKAYRWSGSVYVYITSGVVDSVNGQTGVVNITTITGNAGTATKLQTSRNIALAGAIVGSVNFDGSADVSISTTLGAQSFIQSSGLSSSWGSTNGTNTGAVNAIMGTSSSATWLLSGTSGGVFRSGIQSLDSNGMLRLYSNSNYIEINGNQITGNISTASALATGRTIGMTGDVTWTSASFNGSANVTGTATLANSGVTAGTYKSVTVDAKGRVTAGTNPTTLSGYGITDAQPQLVSGTNIKTINGTSVLGSGNIVVTGGSSSSISYQTLSVGNEVLNIGSDDIYVIATTNTVIYITFNVTVTPVMDRLITIVNNSGRRVVYGSNQIPPYSDLSLIHKTDNTFIVINSSGDSLEYRGYTLTLSASYSEAALSSTLAPHIAKYPNCEVTLIGGGGGGGSGRKGATSTARHGGQGGTGGAISKFFVPSIHLESGVSLTIGAGGAGGASKTINSNNGSDGSTGGDTYLTGIYPSLDSTNYIARGGIGGKGGTPSTSTARTGSRAKLHGLVLSDVSSNSASSVVAKPSSPAAIQSLQPTAGGTGGGINTANLAFNGGNGGAIIDYVNGNNTEIIAGGLGGVVDSTQPTSTEQTGAGGGAGSVTTNAQNGASNTSMGYGCGGGGGGASTDDVGDSGAGGKGGDGLCIFRFFM